MQISMKSGMTIEVAALVEELLLEANLTLVQAPAAAGRCINRALCLLAAKPGGIQTSEQPPAPVGGGLAPWQVRRLTALIEAHLAETLLSADLAAAVRLSTSHFSRAFTRSFGVAPHAYVVERRVAHAKYLIETTDSVLCDVALACGLADQAHLSRTFRRVVGQTPKSWRRSCINRNTRSARAERLHPSSASEIDRLANSTC
jgi:AraC family transcriptional regulator